MANPEIRELESEVGTPTSVFVERTITFTDVVGSTVVAEQEGDLALVEILREHHRIARDVACCWSGEVVKYTGDGSMLAFPCAGDAVAAAIDAQRAAIGAGLQLRIGADHGLVVSFQGDYVGLVANVAARLAGLAGIGQVLLSERVTEAAGLSCESRPLRVRGLRTRQRVRAFVVTHGAN